MQSIELPDIFHVTAASGWLELGSPAEAEAELSHIKPTLRIHPQVLQLRWHISAAAKKWNESLEIALALKAIEPDDSFAWVHVSYSLHELKRTQEAFEQLLPAHEKFNQEHIIPYNLACYCAQLGKLEDAERWLTAAIKRSTPARIKTMAVNDPDLAPLWQQKSDFWERRQRRAKV